MNFSLMDALPGARTAFDGHKLDAKKRSLVFPRTNRVGVVAEAAYLNRPGFHYGWSVRHISRIRRTNFVRQFLYVAGNNLFCPPRAFQNLISFSHLNKASVRFSIRWSSN